MRYYHLAVGLLSPATVLSQYVSTSTVSIGVCFPSGSAGGNGTGSGGFGSGSGGYGSGSSGSNSVVVQSVSCGYGIYELQGWYAVPSSGSLLGGQTTTSSEMSLSYCASYCQGSPYFAVEAGNQCICGRNGPTSLEIGVSGSCSACSGKGAECCGSDTTCIVYQLTPLTPSLSVTMVPTTSTDAQGSVHVTSTPSTIPAPSTSYITMVPTTSTDAQGSVHVTSTPSTIPAPSTSYITMVPTTSTDAQGSVHVTSTPSTVLVTPTQSAPPSSSGGVSTAPAPTRTFTAISSSSNVALSTASSSGTGSPSTPSSSNTVIPTTAALPCPAADGQVYQDIQGVQYNINCNCSYPGKDLTAVHEDTFEACILACDNWVPQPSVAGGASCVAASWGEGNVGGNCYLKYAIGTIYYGDVGFDSCKKTNYTAPSPTLTTQSPRTSATSTSGGTTPTSTPVYQCGSQAGGAFCDPAAGLGTCCSSAGYCGSTDAYCLSANGCQSNCTDPSPRCGSQYADALCPANDPSGTCCSSAGYCGSTDAYCLSANGCQSNCTDPTPRCGFQYAGALCPANDPSGTCCSSYGYCGSTDAYCLPANGCQSGCNSTSPSTSSGGAITPSTSPTSSSSSSTAISTPTTSSTPSTTSGTSTTSSLTPATLSSPSSSTTPSSIPLSSATSTTPSPITASSPTGTSSTAEPTLTTAPVCGANNNTQYTDIFSTTYEIKCGLQIKGSNGYAVHADTFIKCLEYCDILGGCAAVTYLDGAASVDSNCYPYTTFLSYQTNSPTGVYSGVAINGPTSGSVSNKTLCPADDGTVQTDTFGKNYNIGCNKNIAGSGPTAGQDLKAAVAPTLYGCLLYCSIYNTCVGADFTGYPVAQNAANCYPKFAVGNVTLATGTSYGSLQ